MILLAELVALLLATILFLTFIVITLNPAVHPPPEPPTKEMPMSQDFQMIGQLSPQVDAIEEERLGWLGTTPEPQGHNQIDASDFSYWGSRANGQHLGSGPGAIPNYAGYVEPPMAAITARPTAEITAVDPQVPVRFTDRYS